MVYLIGGLGMLRPRGLAQIAGPAGVREIDFCHPFHHKIPTNFHNRARYGRYSGLKKGRGADRKASQGTGHREQIGGNSDCSKSAGEKKPGREIATRDPGFRETLCRRRRPGREQELFPAAVARKSRSE